MTITIPNLSGNFEYPPKTLAWLIEHFWDATKTDGITPHFIKPADTDTQDPWYDNVAPAIVFRKNGHVRSKRRSTGDGLFRMEMDISIHVFAITQLQQFKFINQIREILDAHHLAPIIKWSEYSPDTIPANQENDSGLKMIEPPSPVFNDAEDNQVTGDTSENHCLGVTTAIWYEFNN